MRCFSQHGIARIKRMRKPSQQIPGPMSISRFLSVQGRANWSRIQEINHFFFRPSLNARRTLAFVGGEINTSAFPKNFSHGDVAFDLARCRTAFRTYSATLSSTSAAAFSHSAFSSAGKRIESVSLMSALSHRRAEIVNDSRQDRRPGFFLRTVSIDIPGSFNLNSAHATALSVTRFFRFHHGSRRDESS
jgi:hypothetical protein